MNFSYRYLVVERPASAGRKVERLFVRKWSDSDSHKKARSFAGPLDAIVS